MIEEKSEEIILSDSSVGSETKNKKKNKRDSSDKSKLVATLNELVVKTQEVETEIESLKTSIELNRKELADLNDNPEIAKKEISLLKKTIKNLSSILEEKNLELEQLKSENEYLKVEIQKQKNKIKEQSLENEENNSRLSELENALTQEKSENFNLREYIRHIESFISLINIRTVHPLP